MKLYNKSDKNRILSDEPFKNNLDSEPYRNNWWRDYARLIHSPSFRRLQGKTQLYPGVESDFFRNRLTHSLEVAQIAKSIAFRLNYNYNQQGTKRIGKQKEFGISTELVEFAGLAHDIGHPPFGHQGEEALDKCMKKHGGFEGNAQTIRILTKIEKKFRLNDSGIKNYIDKRIGLNLCMRTIASVLKYDKIIPETLEDRKALAKDKHNGKVSPVKGYYKCDNSLVSEIKKSVLNGHKIKKGDFKTIECYIMDLADDIAYSTYDLEDGFKAGFISPLDLLYPSPELKEEVITKVNINLKKENIKESGKYKEFKKYDEISDLIREKILPFEEPEKTRDITLEDKGNYFLDFANIVVDEQFRASKLIANDGSLRTGFTSSIVGRFVRGVELEYNKNCPALSKAKLNDETRILVEILKIFTYMSQITSPRLKIAEFRGKEIVTKIFDTLNLDDIGHKLMPDDIQEIYKKTKGSYSKRIICDYIASMTNKYAIEFYGRLTSEKPETIFKPF